MTFTKLYAHFNCSTYISEFSITELGLKYLSTSIKFIYELGAMSIIRGSLARFGDLKPSPNLPVDTTTGPHFMS